MRKTTNRMKVVGLLASGCMLFQFGGCSLDAFLNQAQIGFSRGFGAIPAQTIYDLTIGQWLGDFLAGGGEGE